MANGQHNQARIYLPGFCKPYLIKALIQNVPPVREIRLGFAVPPFQINRTMEKVWHIEFEDISISPALYAATRRIDLGTAHYDEIAQKRIHPGSSHIFSTQYKQSEVSEEKLEPFKQTKYTAHIYDGEHPTRSKTDYLVNQDGIIVIADLSGLDFLVKILEQGAGNNIIVTKEHKIF